MMSALSRIRLVNLRECFFLPWHETVMFYFWLVFSLYDLSGGLSSIIVLNQIQFSV